jgi:hypothetical protein
VRGSQLQAPFMDSRADNSNGHILEAYADEHGLCILGPQQPTHLATTGTMDVLDIAILKDIRLTTAIEALHELSSDHLPVILELGDEKDTPKTITRFFTNWDKYAEFLETTLPPCPSLPSTPALLDDAVALFESALNMARTTATTTREVTYRPIACLTN